MKSQTVGDLRTLVTRRAGIGRRVALLSSDSGLSEALEQNGCTVLKDPASLDEVAAFGPQVVVAFDGFGAEGQTAFRVLSQAVPEAEFVFSFANASSAGTLLNGLLGGSLAPALSERDVRTWLREAGLTVCSRDVVVTGHLKTGLCAETESALRQLFEQLNPDAAADRFLLVAKRGVEPSVVEPTAGLTSVIIAASADDDALVGTLKSVASQLRRPLEVIVVAPWPEHKLEEAVRGAQGRAGLKLLLVGDALADTLAQTNVGLALAQGQYVCCLESGELLDSKHLSSLISRLESGTEAWALSSPEVDVGNGFHLQTWLRKGTVHRGRYVIDRTRLGSFPLVLAEGTALGEAMFFCRLAALFEPARVSARCTFDSQRTVSSSVAEVADAMRARPLRSIESLESQLKPTEPIDVQALVQAQLDERSKTAGRLFSQALKFGQRVRQAAVEAQVAAKKELGR